MKGAIKAMSDSYMDAMGKVGGVSDYTLDEIKQAEKLKKKRGGTLMENLELVTGRAYSPKLSFGSDTLTDAIVSNHEKLDREIKELNANLARDFGITPAIEAPEKQTPAPLNGTDALERFNDVAETVEKKVFGQSEFIKKLLIAFKRPYVMPPKKNGPKNVMFISGRPFTGRHLSIRETAAALKDRGLLKSSDITVVDLGLYSDASSENIFLQDIYSALSDESEIILFENFDGCHPSILSKISALVTEGSFKLPGRYILQKGQLVSVQNGLASGAVSDLKAEGKYLVFITEKSPEKAAGILGGPVIDALKGDICMTKELDSEALRRIADTEAEALKKEAASRLDFDIELTEDFIKYALSRSERGAGAKGVLDLFETVSQALAQARLERDLDKGAKLKLSVEDSRLFAETGDGGERLDLSALLPESFKGEIDDIRRELDAIVGLDEIKSYVLGLEEYYSVQKRRQEEGLKTADVSKHMIFTGSPGTGKTTIARIISRYLKAIGVLSGGQLIEVSRADLVGRYVGHTAPLTNQVIKSALGGVLFIDEAYSLYRGKDDSYGLEAIDTLVKGIEDNRDDLIVILAGYSKEMQEFLTSNSGLKSRFPNIINFPDYTGDELLRIARSIAGSKGYTIDEGADGALRDYFDGVQATRAADAGNGRLARNMVEDAILNQSRRLVAEPEAELSLLILNDFTLD